MFHTLRPYSLQLFKEKEGYIIANTHVFKAVSLGDEKKSFRTVSREYTGTVNRKVNRNSRTVRIRLNPSAGAIFLYMFRKHKIALSLAERGTLKHVFTITQLTKIIAEHWKCSCVYSFYQDPSIYGITSAPL